MIRIRRSNDRGSTKAGWLDGRHTFSFGEYHDPLHQGFRALRVINEDRVAPASGFQPHSHRDMEIVTVVLEGELEHQDSMGNRGLIRAFPVDAHSTICTSWPRNPCPRVMTCGHYLAS